jgi:hypothetical protein
MMFTPSTPMMNAMMPAGAMPVPAMPVLPTMMATVALDMKPGATVCRMAPAPGMDAEAFQDCCDMMQLMLKAGMPVVMQCGNLTMSGMGEAGIGMPMMPVHGLTPVMACRMHFDLQNGAMLCRLTPGRDMDGAMFDSACMLMEKMLRVGMPLTMICNGMQMMCCTVK